MKNYREISKKYLKRNKKNNRYIIMSLILINILVVTTICSLNIWEKVLEKNSYKINGKYSLEFTDVTNQEINKIKNNIEVESYSVFGDIGIEKIGDKKSFILYSANENLIQDILKDRIKIIKGEYPKNKNEIMITERTERVLKKYMGDYIEVNGSKYEIVGIYKVIYGTYVEFEGITTGNLENAKNKEIFITLKNENNKASFIKDIGKSNIEIKDNKSYSNVGRRKFLIEGITIVVWIIFIVLIYGCIQSRLKEREKILIIIKNLGGTKEKLEGILLIEIITLVLKGTVIGIFIGMIFSDLVVKDLILSIMGSLGENITLHIGEMVKSGIETSVISLTAIIISVKIVIKNLYKTKYKVKNKKIRKNKLIEKFLKNISLDIFLAYKNIRGDKKSFRVTIFMLSTILIVFSTTTAYYTFSKKIIKESAKKDITIFTNQDNKALEKIVEKLRSEGIQNIESKEEIKNDTKEIEISFDISNINDDKFREIENLVQDNNMAFINNYKYAKENQIIIEDTVVLIYLGVVFLCLITGINIINFTYINMEKRKKEFAILIGIGTRKNKIRKILIIEELTKCLMASFIGGIISFVSISAIYLIYYFSGQIVEGIIPYYSILVGIVLISGISIISGYLAIRSLKFSDIMKKIKEN